MWSYNSAYKRFNRLANRIEILARKKDCNVGDLYQNKLLPAYLKLKSYEDKDLSQRERANIRQAVCRLGRIEALLKLNGLIEVPQLFLQPQSLNA